jgi:hypothetical protein
MSYYCAAGMASREEHPRVYVSERQLLPWIRDEAARLTIPHDSLEVEHEDAATAETLRAKRARYIEMYGELLIDKAERDRRLADIDRQIERLESRHTIVEIPEIDWTKPPSVVNNVLRFLWRYVQLDEQLHPITAEWTVPEWRA